MLEWLHYAQLQWVVGFIRNVAHVAPLDIPVHGNFYALLSKTLHGPIVNGRPRK